MSFLTGPTDAGVEAGAAGEDAARMYAEDRAAQGYVANYTRTFAARPTVYRAWQQLSGAVRAR